MRACVRTCVYMMLSLMVSSHIVHQKILPGNIPNPLVLAFAAAFGHSLLMSVSSEKKRSIEMKLTGLTLPCNWGANVFVLILN